ncbi:photosystem I reaction center subunit IX, partial [Prochlorothrix hollandica PCC 9006 = CALU 1027]
MFTNNAIVGSRSKTVIRTERKIHTLYLAIINTMTTALRQRESANAWEQFCQWIASTENRLYVGWFGVIMI